MGGLLTLGSFVKTFPDINTLADPSNTSISTRQGITVASYNLGCFIGAILTMFIGDILGRRRMIFLGSSIVVVGAVLQASSFSLGQLVAGVRITLFLSSDLVLTAVTESNYRLWKRNEHLHGPYVGQ